MLILNTRGYIKNRESQNLEFKQAMQYGDSLLEYARTLAGMANNQGGRIIFGVQNSPHIPIGLKNYKFQNLDPRKLNQVFLQYFSTDVDWSMDTFEQFEVTLGQISVLEATTKPIVCSQTHDRSKLREGAIYFRYRGETREVRYQELKDMLDWEKEKEKNLWMNHIKSIATIGPQAVQIVDAQRGEMDIGGSKVLIDSELISKLKVVKEGHFDERADAPALRLIGEISGLVDTDTAVYTEAAYPYVQASFTEKLPINSYEFQALAWKFSLKGDPRYHAELKTGSKSSTNKYSDKALSLLRDKMREDPDLVKRTKTEFSDHKRKG